MSVNQKIKMSTMDEAAIFVNKNDGPKSYAYAFLAWKYLVNKYIELTSEVSKERIEHLMKPLQAFNSQTSDMCTIKFKIWWDLIVALETHIEKVCFSIIYNFLNFCFGSVSRFCKHCDSATSGVCKTHCSVCCNPELNFSVESLKETTCIDAKYLSNVLAQLLCLKCEPPRKNNQLRQLHIPLISLPVHFQSMSKLLLHCVAKCTVLLVNGKYDPKFKMYSLRKIWTNLMYQIKRIEKIPPIKAQDLPKAFKHCAKAEVFKNVFCILSKLGEISKENENLVNTCLNPILETVLSKKNGLSEEVLTSEDYYWGPGDPRTPLYTMLDILLSPSFVGIKSDKNEALFLSLLDRLFELGIGPEHSTIAFVQEVIEKLDMALNLGTSIRPNILRTIWNIITRKLTIYMKLGQNINQGNENEADFKCIYLILMFPVTNIEFFAFEHESIFRSWKQLFSALQKNLRLYSGVENDVCDNIFRQLYQEVEKMNAIDYDELFFVMNLVTTVLERIPFEMVNKLHSSCTALTQTTCVHQSLKLLHLLSSKTTNLSGRNDMYFKILFLFAKCSAIFCKNLQVCVPKDFVSSLEDFINFLLNVNVNHPEALQYYVKIMRNMWDCFLNNFVKHILCNNFDKIEVVSTLQNLFEKSFVFPDHEIHIISMQFLLFENWYLNLEMNKCMLCGDSFKSYKEIKSIVCNEKCSPEEVDERKKYLIQKVQNFFLGPEEVANSHESNDNEMEPVEILPCEREREQVEILPCEREREQVEILPSERDNVSSRKLPEQEHSSESTSEVHIGSVESTRGTEISEETGNEKVENVNTSSILSSEVLNSVAARARESISEEKRANVDTQPNNKSMIQSDTSDLLIISMDYSSTITENVVNEGNVGRKFSSENVTTSVCTLTDAQPILGEKKANLDSQQNNKFMSQYNNSDLLTAITDHSNEITENIENERNAENNHSYENLSMSSLPISDARKSCFLLEDERTHIDSQQISESVIQCDSDVLTVLTDYSNEINENIVNKENTEKENSHANLTTSLLSLPDAQDKRNNIDAQQNNKFVIARNGGNIDRNLSHENLTSSLSLLSDSQPVSEVKKTQVDTLQNNKSITQSDSSDLLTALTAYSNQFTLDDEHNVGRKHENLTATLLPFTDAHKSCSSSDAISEKKQTDSCSQNNDSSIIQIDNNNDSLIVVSDTSEGITDSIVNENMGRKNSQCKLTTFSFPAKQSTNHGGRNAISMNEENQCLFTQEANAKFNETEKELIQVADANKQCFKVTLERKQYELDKESNGRSEKYKNNVEKKKKKKNKHKKCEESKKKSLQHNLMDTTHSTNSVSLKCPRKAPIIIRIARIKGDKNVVRYYIKNLNGAENTEQQATPLTEDYSTSVDIGDSNEIHSEEILNSASNSEININDLVEKNMECALTEVGKSLLECEISNNNETMNETNSIEGNFEIAKNKESMGDKDLTLSDAHSLFTEVVSNNNEKTVDARSPQVSGKFSIEHEQINICFKNGEDNNSCETSKSITKFTEHGSEETFNILNCPEENVTSTSFRKFEEKNELLNNLSCTPQKNIKIAFGIEKEIPNNQAFIPTKTHMTLMNLDKSKSENRLINNVVENEKISLEEEIMSNETQSSLMDFQSSVSKEPMNNMRISSENVQIFIVKSNSHENNEQCKTHKLLLEFQESNSEKTQNNSTSSKANISIEQTEDGEDCIMDEAYQPLQRFQESVGEKILKDYNDSSENNLAIEKKIIDRKDCVGTSASLMEFQDSASNSSQENISIDDEKYQRCVRFIGKFKECSDFTSMISQKKSNFYNPLDLGKSLIDFNILKSESLQKAVQNFLPTILECKSSLSSQHSSDEFENIFESNPINNKKTHIKKINPQVLEKNNIEFASSVPCPSKSITMIQPGKVENKFDLKNDANNAINVSENRNMLTLNIDHPIETEIQKNLEKIIKNSDEYNSKALSLRDDGKIVNMVTQGVHKEQSSQECNFPFDNVEEFSVKCSLSSFKDTLQLFGKHEGSFNLSTGCLNSSHQGKISQGLENLFSESEPDGSSNSIICVSPSSKSFDTEHFKSNNFSPMLQYFHQGVSQLFDWKTIFKIQGNSALVSDNIHHLLNKNNENLGKNITLSFCKEGNQILINVKVKNDQNDNNIISIKKCESLEGIVSKFSCLSSQAYLNAKLDLLPSASNSMDMESRHNIFKTHASQLFIKGNFMNDNKPCDLPSTSSASTSSFIHSIPEVPVHGSSEIRLSGENESCNKKCEFQMVNVQESLATEGGSYVGNTIIESLCPNLNSGIEQSSSIENVKQSIIAGTPTLLREENQLYGELINNENIRYQLSSQLEPQTKFIKQCGIDENNLLPIQSPNSCLETKNESEIDKTKTDNSEIKKDCKELETNSHGTSLYNMRVCCTRKCSSSCSLLANNGKAVTRNLRKRNTERNIFTRRCTLECCSWMDKREGITKQSAYVKDSKINFVKAFMASKRRILNPKLCKSKRHNVKELNVCSLVNANEVYSSFVREKITSEEKRTRTFTKKKTCCFLCDFPKTSVHKTAKFSLPEKDSFCKSSKKEDLISSNKGKTLQTIKNELNNAQGTRNNSEKKRRTKAKQIMICAFDSALQANINNDSRIENKITCLNLHSKKRKCEAMLQDSTSLELEQTLINKPRPIINQKMNENACRNFDYSKKLKREMITNCLPASTQSVSSLLENISRPTLIDYCTRKRKLHDIELKENCAIKVCRLELKPGSCLQGKEESYIVTEMTSSLSAKVTKSDGGINLTSGPVQNCEIASNAHCNEILKKDVNDVIIPANNCAIKEENVFSQLSLRGKQNNVPSSIENLEEGFKGCGKAQ